MTSYYEEKKKSFQNRNSIVHFEKEMMNNRIPKFINRVNTISHTVEFDLSKQQEPIKTLEPSEELNKYDFSIPEEFSWSVEEVVDWVVNVVNLPQYKEAFYNNCIDGKNLVRLKPGDFPKMNIRNFEHIKHLLKCLRELFQVREAKYLDSIAFPSRKVVRHQFLTQKSRSEESDSSLTPLKFLLDENLVHECWNKPTADNDYPLLILGRRDVPLHKLCTYTLNMDLVKQSEELPFLL